MHKKRKSVRDMTHAAEHLDEAMTRIALAENIIIKAIKREKKVRRKNDRR